MKLKHRPNDFRVRELLDESYIESSGSHLVYRVTKRKLTSLEAAEVLANMAGIEPGDISMAGLKDRQGVTEQYMSARGGKTVELSSPELKIVPVGRASNELTSEHSRGNHFEIRLRDLTHHEQRRLFAHRATVERLGVPNYFDEQRFGNLRYGQGWIARELMEGRHEEALKSLLCAASERDSGAIGAFKRALRESWGDWSACREVAGRFGQHHSVFDHLRRNEGDFAGAFFHVSSRLRLIHLYAFQSHLWNRAVARMLAARAGDAGARVALGLEGPLVFPDHDMDPPLDPEDTFRLPGEGLEDVEDPVQRSLLAGVLADEGLEPERFRIEGVSGFQLKGEDRALMIQPRDLRVRREDPRGRQGGCSLSFELPRGAYATLVVRALVARFVRGPVDLEDLDHLREDEGGHGGHRPVGRRGQGRRGRGAAAQGFGGGPRGQGRWDDRGEGRGHGRRDDRGEGRAYGRRDDRGEGRGYGRRDDRNEGRGYGRRDDRGEGRGYGRRDDRGEGVGYGRRDDRGGGGGYGRRDDRGQGGGYGRRDDRGEGGGYRRRDDRDEGRGYGRRVDHDESRGYGRREDHGGSRGGPRGGFGRRGRGGRRGPGRRGGGRRGGPGRRPFDDRGRGERDEGGSSTRYRSENVPPPGLGGGGDGA